MWAKFTYALLRGTQTQTGMRLVACWISSGDVLRDWAAQSDSLDFFMSQVQTQDPKLKCTMCYTGFFLLEIQMYDFV